MRQREGEGERGRESEIERERRKKKKKKKKKKKNNSKAIALTSCKENHNSGDSNSNNYKHYNSIAPSLTKLGSRGEELIWFVLVGFISIPKNGLLISAERVRVDICGTHCLVERDTERERRRERGIGYVEMGWGCMVGRERWLL